MEVSTFKKDTTSPIKLTHTTFTSLFTDKLPLWWDRDLKLRTRSFWHLFWTRLTISMTKKLLKVCPFLKNNRLNDRSVPHEKLLYRFRRLIMHNIDHLYDTCGLLCPFWSLEALVLSDNVSDDDNCCKFFFFEVWLHSLLFFTCSDSSNGKVCYTCNETNCSTNRPLECKGVEDQCITGTGKSWITASWNLK